MKFRSIHASIFFLIAASSVEEATAHPHMFVDARPALTLDAEGRLTGVRTRLLVDELTTLFVLEEHGVLTTDEPFTDPQREAIGAGVADGLKHYDYFTNLKVAGERLVFANVSVRDVGQEEGRLAATLELTLQTPQDVRGHTVELALYDPTYYAAVDTLAPPELPEQLADCVVNLVKFEPTSVDAETLLVLSALSREETPEEPRIGARFADRSTVICAR